MIRAIILSATIAALVVMWGDKPKPVVDDQEPYCLISYKAAMRHPLTGELVFGWAQGYGPCRLQDIYREI